MNDLNDRQWMHPCEHNTGLNGYHCERWNEEHA